MIEQDERVVTPRVLKRYGNQFSEKDVGNIRRFVGDIISVDISARSPVIKGRSNDKTVEIVLVPAFFSTMNDVNKEIIFDVLSLISQVSINEDLLLVVMGEVHKNSKSSYYELHLYDPDSIVVDGVSISSFKAHYTAKKFRGEN
ncbi:hypothetical protein MFLO_14212 [Listeria floridensis FSL S10-1187]|uniref:Uncharacterized protein n=1 Tax=Listeria floridensis FSL S10-1187 TaxID=1265817 RepID=A0ABP3AUC6_9LIST|nr:hypothetical protein [Listeria floridensis]EUJ26119.1 hypothetical protein MFLO_14212 [Listeria floridensis FSL S10-1187]